MDPLTHTLFGASLADSGLGRRTGLATATLIVGANLPDVDFVTYFVDGDLSLWFRRGWTHGVLAWLVLPLVLTGLMVVWDRWVRRRRDPTALPADPGTLWVLATLAVLSHPTLDWLNTYGVRFLMPFDGRWFYGDVLFIIEPILWLVLGGAVFLRHSRSPRALVAWGVLAVLTTLAVFAGAGPVARISWVMGLITLVALRVVSPSGIAAPSPKPARVALVLFAVYVTTLMAGDALIEREVRAAWRTQGDASAVGPIDAVIEDVMVGPLPANPLHRDVIVVAGEHYHFFRFDWRRSPRLSRAEPASLPRLPDTPEIEAAMTAPCLRGLANWTRFPAAQVVPHDEGHTEVRLMDARYTRRPTTSFGGDSVVLDPDLQPICHPP